MISGERQLRERAKEEIRRKLTAVRRTIPAPQRLERSQKIVDRIDGLAEWMGAQCVGAYSPIRGEVDMEPLFTRARAQGKRIALPRTDFDQGTMDFCLLSDDMALVDTGRGFLQPGPDAPALGSGEVDLFIVPAIAVDPQGNRLGWGKGFYDRFLSVHPDVPRIGVVFDFQVLIDLPVGEHDQPLHHIVTDQRILSPRTR